MWVEESPQEVQLARTREHHAMGRGFALPCTPALFLAKKQSCEMSLGLYYVPRGRGLGHHRHIDAVSATVSSSPQHHLPGVPPPAVLGLGPKPHSIRPQPTADRMLRVDAPAQTESTFHTRNGGWAKGALWADFAHHPYLELT